MNSCEFFGEDTDAFRFGGRVLRAELDGSGLQGSQKDVEIRKTLYPLAYFVRIEEWADESEAQMIPSWRIHAIPL